MGAFLRFFGRVSRETGSLVVSVRVLLVLLFVCLFFICLLVFFLLAL